jgi:hypothetical protein
LPLFLLQLWGGSSTGRAAAAPPAPRSPAPALPRALPGDYEMQLSSHLETPARAGIAWSSGGGTRFRVQYLAPDGPPADPAFGPPPPAAPAWNVGLQLLDERAQCAWWEQQSAPGVARQCVCWPLNASGPGLPPPAPLPDWVSFAAFPAGTVLNGTATHGERLCRVWRVPIAGLFSFWFYYEDAATSAPVGFYTRQMAIDITAVKVGPPQPPLAVPENCYHVPAGAQAAAEAAPAQLPPPPPPLLLQQPESDPLVRPGTTAGSCVTAATVGTATYHCLGKRWTVTVPPQCAATPSVGGRSACGLVVDIHGWNMDGEMQDKNTRLRARGSEGPSYFVTLQPSACCIPPDTSWTDSAGSYNSSAVQVKQVADEIVALYKLDRDRLHVTGFSQGGCMTWQLLAAYPSYWASVAPTACGNWLGVPAGGLPIPLLYQQGVHDGLVPISRGRAAVAELRTAWGLTEHTLVASSPSYNYTRFTSPTGGGGGGGGGLLEMITHEYVGVPVGPLAIWGHCFAGSPDVPGVRPLVKGQLMNFGCPYDPSSAPGKADYDYSEVVAAFFRTHTKRTSTERTLPRLPLPTPSPASDFTMPLRNEDGQLCQGLNNSGAQAPAETDWFFAAKRGVFTHFLNGLQNSFGSNSQGKNSTWSDCVDEFSAEAYAESAAATGAKYAVITMMQGSNNLLGPNARYNELTGYKPGRACSKRDLVLDIHAALAKRGLHMLLYWTGDGPHADAQASAGMGLPGCPGTDPGGMECRKNIPELFVQRWGSVLQEYAVRYGEKVKGWWVDGCYEYFNYTDAKLKSYHDAIRKGNPRAMMAFNGGANYFPIGDCPVCESLTGPMDKCYSRWNDITNVSPDTCSRPLALARYLTAFANEKVLYHLQGEADWGKPPNSHSVDPFNDIPTSRHAGGQQWHTLGFIGQTWAAACNGTCRYTAAQFRDYSRKVAAGGGVLTVDATTPKRKHGCSASSTACSGVEGAQDGRYRRRRRRRPAATAAR